MNRVVNKLKSLNLKNSCSEEVRTLLKKVTILHVPLCIPKGIMIFRTRKGTGLWKHEDLTYCPVEHCTSLQRVTLKGSTMFYGVISASNQKEEYARAIAATECSQLCREGGKSVGKETFCIGCWEIIEPLHIVSLVNDTIFSECNNNILLNRLREHFKSIYNKDNTPLEAFEISDFINTEFSKFVKESENYEYLISATITTEIIEKYGYDGIIYPPVKLEGQGGMNIALTPKAVNEKLRLIKVEEQTLYKNEEISLICLNCVTENGYVNKIVQITDKQIEEVLGIEVNKLPIR